MLLQRNLYYLKINLCVKKIQNYCLFNQFRKNILSLGRESRVGEGRGKYGVGESRGR